MTSAPRPCLPPRRIRHAIRQFLLAALSFGLVIHALRPHQSSDPLLAAKQRYFQDHKDQFDAIFIGSSRIYRGFDPAIFNKRLGQNGEVKTFNFGIGGLRPHELNHLLHSLLATRPERLRFVFIELMDWSPSLALGLETHPRTVDWHTPLATWQACQTECLSNHSWWTRLHICQQHLALAACWLVNHGNGPRWWQQRTDQPALTSLTNSQLDQGQGYFPLDAETSVQVQQRRARFLRDYYEIFLEQITKIDATNRQTGDLSHFNLRAQKAQEQWLLSKGLQPIYVIPNVRWGTPDLNWLQSRNILQHVLTMNHTDQYPALYQSDHYFDRGHLNQSGAMAFSRTFADLVQPLLNRPDPAPR